MGGERVVVVRPGEGHRVGNVEFLARTIDTPRFNGPQQKLSFSGCRRL